jgi:hypothetical protein
LDVIFITKINNMKTNIIKALFGLILTFFISGLYAQSPRIKLNQIVKDTVSGSVLISNLADSNMVYSRNFYINAVDTSLVFFGTTIVAGGGGGGSFVTLPQLTDSLALYATKVQLSDSMATVLKQVATDLTLTGDGSVGNPLKVDTTTYIATKGDLNNIDLASQVTGTLPIANGGTGSATQNFVDLTNAQTVGGAKTFTSTVTGTRFDPTSSSTTGNGMFLPTTNILGFSTNGSERMRIDASGNLGIAGTPSAWNLSGLNALQIKNAFLYGYRNEFGSGSNSFFDGSNWTYIASDYATRYEQVSGTHAWLTAPSGTAGNAISFTQAMTLDANGRLGIGTTGPVRLLHLKGTTDPSIQITDGTSGDTNSDGLLLQFSAGNTAYIYNFENGPMYFGTNNNTRMTILDGGNVGIGTTPTEKLDVDGNARFRSIGSGASAGALHYTSTGVLTTNTSDVRLKTNLQPLQNTLNKLLDINTYTFNWINETDRVDLGMIAQEVEEIFPRLVFTNPVDGYKGIHYDKFSSILTKAIQEQQSIIESQATEIETLKTQIQLILSEIEQIKNN